MTNFYNIPEQLATDYFSKKFKELGDFSLLERLEIIPDQSESFVYHEIKKKGFETYHSSEEDDFNKKIDLHYYDDKTATVHLIQVKTVNKVSSTYFVDSQRVLDDMFNNNYQSMNDICSQSPNHTNILLEV